MNEALVNIKEVKKPMKQLLKTVRGQMNPMTLVSFAVVLALGVTIFYQIDPGVSTSGLSGASLAARQNVTANTYGGFQTLSVSPTVIAAVIVLGIVGMLAYRSR